MDASTPSARQDHTRFITELEKLDIDLPPRDSIEESRLVKDLCQQLPNSEDVAVSHGAKTLIDGMRASQKELYGFQTFLQRYDLSTEEGVLLMCLAESLLRVPDGHTMGLLIEDKISHANWESHISSEAGLFSNASTWGLMLTGKLFKKGERRLKSSSNLFSKLMDVRGEALVRTVVKQAIKHISGQFILAERIDKALKARKNLAKRGYNFSFDMLGESARTDADAKGYFDSYMNAITAIGNAAHNNQFPSENDGISIKLSALHPRYELAKLPLLVEELLPRLKTLAKKAAQYNIGLTFDAEETERLVPSLYLFRAVAQDPALSHWQGLGLAVQAYQTRALPTLKWLKDLAQQTQRQLMVRLVKGAYWDSEIKHAQELGLANYPVFTHKAHTDISYLACADFLFAHPDAFYPQMATHNAYTISALRTYYRDANYEFQCLFGMSHGLYNQFITSECQQRCRIYAPVGGHKDLLSYLIRRLLENGANSSFLNQIYREDIDINALSQSPAIQAKSWDCAANPHIPQPKALYPGRTNAKGFDFEDPSYLQHFASYAPNIKRHSAAPTANADAKQLSSTSPQDLNHTIGTWQMANDNDIHKAYEKANQAWPKWRMRNVNDRAELANTLADAIEADADDYLWLLIQEAGKSLKNAISELREAVDFCRFYAKEAIAQFAEPTVHPGPSGELNFTTYHGRGVFVTISPWNFPLAIFTGSLIAPLLAGNVVLAKSAPQTPLIAQKLIDSMHQVGFDSSVIQHLPGDGATGQALIEHPLCAGVVFTGSCRTAKAIARTLAIKPGPIVPFIAETGGQNAMIIDSSALLEQALDAIVESSFDSAGQRCSALRVCYVQQEIFAPLMNLLKGALACQCIGSPQVLLNDTGPVIDQGAQQRLQAHIDNQNDDQWVVKPLTTPTQGTFIAPGIVQIPNLATLEEEVFGPILHVIPYSSKALDRVIGDINQAGFGLTLGIQSRIDTTIDYICKRVRVGNIYVNRNIIGAVVESQPFGGQGLSGTGPKAGGVDYLKRMAFATTTSNNISAIGGDPVLLQLSD